MSDGFWEFNFLNLIISATVTTIYDHHTSITSPTNISRHILSLSVWRNIIHGFFFFYSEWAKPKFYDFFSQTKIIQHSHCWVIFKLRWFSTKQVFVAPPLPGYVTQNVEYLQFYLYLFGYRVGFLFLFFYKNYVKRTNVQRKNTWTFLPTRISFETITFS